MASSGSFSPNSDVVSAFTIAQPSQAHVNITLDTDLDQSLKYHDKYGTGDEGSDVVCPPSSEQLSRTVPPNLDVKQKFVLEEPPDRMGSNRHSAPVYIFAPFFRVLHETFLKEESSQAPFRHLPVSTILQQQTVDSSSAAAWEACNNFSPIITVRHPCGTLGWLLLAYQAEDADDRIKLAREGKSGLHLAFKGRILDCQASFLSKSESQKKFMAKVKIDVKTPAYKSLKEMVHVDPALLEGVPAEYHPMVPFTLKHAIAWVHGAGGGNHYMWLGGMGVTGVFLVNDAHFSLNNCQDDLKDSHLTAFLDAKLMEHMMDWVLHNPPPDMAAAIRKHEQALALKEEKKILRIAKYNAKAAVMNEKMKRKAEKAKGQRAALGWKGEQNAPEKPEPLDGIRRASLKAIAGIKTVFAQEAARDEQIFGADEPVAPKTPPKHPDECEDTKAKAVRSTLCKEETASATWAIKQPQEHEDFKPVAAPVKTETPALLVEEVLGPANPTAPVTLLVKGPDTEAVPAPYQLCKAAAASSRTYIKRPWDQAHADIAPDIPGHQDKRVCPSIRKEMEDSNGNMKWAAFLADPAINQGPSSHIDARKLLGEKVLAVMTTRKLTVDQLIHLNKLYTILGDMKRACEFDKKEINASGGDRGWVAFMADSKRQQTLWAHEEVCLLFGIKLRAVVTEPLNVDQLIILDEVHKALGNMPHPT